MEEQTALPTDGNVAAGEQAQNTQAAAASQEAQQPPAEGQETQGAEQSEPPDAGKKEKTPEQREIERLRRRVDNLTRRRYEAEARATVQPPSQGQQRTQASDDEPVTLSRADLDRIATERARELAPVVAQQQAEIERRQGVVSKLEKAWGKDEFSAKASDLEEVFGGLQDAQGGLKPATEAIFDADDPKAVIEYLTDPDNAEEAERIARLPAHRAGREIARIEVKLEEAKRNAKPRPSNAARPIESVKGGGVPNGMPDPANTKAYIAWANEQDRAARR